MSAHWWSCPIRSRLQSPMNRWDKRNKRRSVCVCADFYTHAFPVTPRPKGLVSTLYHRKKLNGTMEEYHEQYRLLLHLLQGSAMAKQLGAEAYLECSAFTSEKSIHSVFRTAAMACINKLQPLPKPSPTRRLSKRLLHLPSKSDLISTTFKKEKAKSCSVMWVETSWVTVLTLNPHPLRLWSRGRGGGHDGFIRVTCWILPSPPQETKHHSEEVDTSLSTCSWTF